MLGEIEPKYVSSGKGTIQGMELMNFHQILQFSLMISTSLFSILMNFHQDHG